MDVEVELKQEVTYLSDQISPGIDWSSMKKRQPESTDIEPAMTGEDFVF